MIKYTAVLFLSIFAFCVSAPASNQENIGIVPLARSDGQPIIDTGFFGGPIHNPFGNIFEGIESMMQKMRQQIDQVFGSLPGRNGSVFGNGIHVPPFPDIDLGKGNTTSITKIIDGHKVVINDTEYKHEDEVGSAIFKIHTIDVKPDSSEVSDEITTASSKEVELLTDDAKENEILSKSNENEVGNKPEKLIVAK